MSLSIFLTAYLWLFLGAVLGALALITFKVLEGACGRCRDFSDMAHHLDLLLRSGYEGGFLRMCDEDSGRFLYFRKYIRGPGDYGLEFRGLGAPNLEDARRRARAFADARGLAHRSETVKAPDGSWDLLVIDCGRDATTAYDMTTFLWTKVFGLPLKTRFKVGMDGRADLGELIDRPDHLPPLGSFDPVERLKEFDTRCQKLGLPSSLNACLAGLATLVVVISGIGFPVSMLLSRGETPDWSFELGTVGLGGSIASLVFLILLVLSGWAIRKLNVGPVRPIPYFWFNRLARLVRVVTLALPIAVFLAWAGF